MILGGVTMTWLEPDGFWNPDEYTIPQEEKLNASVDTETSNVFFLWGMRLVGKEISLSWEWMSEALFDALDAVYVAGVPVQWYLEDPSAQVYTVEVVSLDGKLFETAAYQQPYRRDVLLKMHVVEEVVSS